MAGNTIPKETETLLQLVHLYFTAPRKDKDAFESYKTRQKQLYANLGADPQIFFNVEFQKLMTQNHPRGGGLPKAERRVRFPPPAPKADVAQLVEQYFRKVEVASSSLAFGSIQKPSVWRVFDLLQ